MAPIINKGINNLNHYMLSKELQQQILSLYFTDTPLTQCEIARRLGISRKTVRYWIEKHKSNTSVCAIQGRKGRPRQLANPEEQRRENKRQFIRSKREDPNYLAVEAESKRQTRKRLNLGEITNRANKRQKIELDLNLACEQPEFQKLADKFFKAVAEGPIHACYCCDRLWFKSSIKSLSKTTLRKKGLTNDFIRLAFYKDIGEIGQFCKTCYDALVHGDIPALAMSNGLEFPEIPDCLRNLNLVEERLISPRIYFGQIYPVHNCQYKLKGSVVNVPISLDTTVNRLPRNMDESYSVYVVLKRRLTHKSNYMAQIINPERVFRAAQYLLQQELYSAFDIGLSVDWFRKFQNREFDMDKLILEFEKEDDEDIDDKFLEVNPSGTHTLISNDSGICLAPGENQTPLSPLFDNCAEELTFPTIYCGRVRHFKNKLSYSQIANSEIRRSDRRAARPDHLLWTYSKLNRIRLRNTIQISIRKKKLLNASLTAENLLDEDFITHLIDHNEGYKCLRALTSSPAHWERERKRVYAAIRQWGIPTLFVTMSAAETHWFQLMKTLSLNVDRHILTEKEFEDSNVFTYDKKRELIQKDPVTCALYFDYRFRQVMKTWKLRDGALGEYGIKYSYYRIEFQHRGSPHVHMILWLENAPVYTPENSEACEKFVDNLMTCSRNNSLVDYQVHHHTATCFKKSGKKEGCRFQIPYFPMDRTRILEPFNDTDSRCNLKEEFIALREYLENLDWKKNKMSFWEFLSSLNFTYEKYIHIIRSGINRVTVFLKREVNEITINNYSPKTLNLMRSNMDIQYITNAYACAAYVVDYINKSQRGLSILLKKCADECRAKNVSVQNCMRDMGNTYLNNTEISAQEAAWSVLELPMSKLSVDDIFVPTFPPSDRARIIKNEEILKGLPKDSADVFQWSILDKYVKRPTDYETLCLADFATGYEFKNEGRVENKLMDSLIYMKERKIRKVLRSVNYKLDNVENYYREQVMLYMPWRNEKEDILDKNFEALFKGNLCTIEFNKRKYNNLDFDIDEIDMGENNETDDSIDERSYGDDQLEFENQFKVDIQRDLDEYAGKESCIFKITNRWEDSKYRSSIRKANIRQFDLLKHVMHLEHNNELPYTLFVTGPAGCGKSFTISILEQTLMRLYDKRSIDPAEVAILKVAPTGKAAFNIQGVTLHAAFALPIKSQNLVALCPSTANEYRAVYRNLKTIIIDEISMVSYTMLSFIDQRMRQIMGNNKPFGNLNVICFGDFRQLPPVGASPVYQIPRSQSMDSLVGNILWERFQFYELTEIMRQKDDMKFAQCLNHVADGTMTEDDIALIQSRVVTDISKIPASPIHLFYSNAAVDGYNALKIASLKTEAYKIKAHDRVTGSGTNISKKNILQKVQRLSRMHTANLDYTLTVKIGARLSLVYNLNTADGLVNGAMGILRKIELGKIKRSKNQAVQTLWIEFDDKEIGTQLRRDYVQYMVRHGIDPRWKWTPITRLRKVVHKTRNSALSVSREQFPIMVSEALTIHKSQGATYNECVVHVQKRMKRSLLYVALSRVTQADGLYVVGEFEPPRPPSKDDSLTEELERLRKSPLIPVYKFLHERSDFAGIQFIFHNVQGLTTHHEDLLADPCFTHSEIIMLAETHTIPTDNFHIPGFQVAGAIDSNGRERTRKNRGVMTYMKEGLIDRNKENVILDGPKVQILISYILENVRFAVCYANPRCTAEEIVLKVSEIMMYDEDRKTVLVGDFNVDFNSSEGKDFIEALGVVGLELRTNPKHYTTRGLTTIDAIFSNKGMRTGVYMTTYSYHLALYGRID